MQKSSLHIVGVTLLMLLFPFGNALALSESEAMHYLQPQLNVDPLREAGPTVIPVLVNLYKNESRPEIKANIAGAFYWLGWKSEDAKEVLLKDINTQHVGLRLQVQWALGRVSNDDEIVPTLLDIMRHDESALFRDKAACALASDQIHLSPQQRFGLVSGLVEALADDNPQVRHIAILALEIQTGQTKGFSANASPAERATRIAAWRRWLKEYEKNL